MYIPANRSSHTCTTPHGLLTHTHQTQQQRLLRRAIPPCCRITTGPIHEVNTILSVSNSPAPIYCSHRYHHPLAAAALTLALIAVLYLFYDLAQLRQNGSSSHARKSYKFPRRSGLGLSIGIVQKVKYISTICRSWLRHTPHTHHCLRYIAVPITLPSGASQQQRLQLRKTGAHKRGDR